MSLLDPFGVQQKMGGALNGTPFSGAGQIMGKMEDPFDLHKMIGMPNGNSPWTAMQADQGRMDDEQAHAQQLLDNQNAILGLMTPKTSQ